MKYKISVDPLNVIEDILFIFTIFITSLIALIIMWIGGINTNDWLRFSVIYAFIWYVLYKIADKLVSIEANNEKRGEEK
jgi:hypothetical protein